MLRRLKTWIKDIVFGSTTAYRLKITKVPEGSKLRIDDVILVSGKEKRILQEYGIEFVQMNNPCE